MQLCAFDVLAMDGDDLRDLPLSMRKANLARLLARRPDGIFVSDFEQGEIGPDLFRKACEFGFEGLVSSIDPIALVGRSIGSRSRTAAIRRDRVMESQVFGERSQDGALIAACNSEFLRI